MVKETKSERELAEILMTEVRKHPECANITGVTFIRPSDRSWQAAWGMAGPTSYGFAKAEEIAQGFRVKFDLAPAVGGHRAT
jgi:hypothetical protein